MRAQLFTPGDAADPSYRNLRDGTSERLRRARAHCKYLWLLFEHHADPEFLTELRSRFNARYCLFYPPVAVAVRLERLGGLRQGLFDRRTALTVIERSTPSTLFGVTSTIFDGHGNSGNLLKGRRGYAPSQVVEPPILRKLHVAPILGPAVR
jgi:hypothetical protein